MPNAFGMKFLVKAKRNFFIPSFYTINKKEVQ